MKKQDVIISRNLEQSLEEAIARCPHDRLFILTDETTQTQCWPVISNFTCLQEAQHITIRPTDDHKDLESLAHVWSELGRLGGTRHSLLINLGGGMVTDLGGFAASTFKRGIAYINIPTTLLAMVDASVGGKTGINCHSRHRVSENPRPRESLLRLCRNAQTWPDQQRRELERTASV